MDFNLPKNISDNYGGLGKVMFDDAFTYHNRSNKIDGIYGEWIKDSDLYQDYGGMSVNLKRFLDAVNAGAPRDQAAFKTVTGEWALSKGFVKVEFTVAPTDSRVEVIFR